MKGDVHSEVSQRNLDALSRASRIYIATVRKDGNQSKPVPVWFILMPDRSVLIQTGRSSWIARRVARGSPVIFWIDKRDGPAVIGDAEITKDPELTKRIVEDYQRKYLLARLGFHRPRPERFHSGEILAIEITPIRDLPDGFAAKPGSLAPGIGGTEPPNDRPPPRPQSIVRAQLANLLSGSRFVLAALWLVAFVSGNRGPVILGSIALARRRVRLRRRSYCASDGSCQRLREMARWAGRHRFHSNCPIERRHWWERFPSTYLS